MFLLGGLSAVRGPLDDFWYGPVETQTAAGVRVSPDSSMQLTVVYRCVHLLSATVAKLPLKLRMRESSEIVSDHPLSRLLTRRPNRWQTPYQFRAMQVSHILLRGNAYAQIVSGSRGELVELVPLHPDRVTIEMTGGGDWRYKVRREEGGTEFVLLRDEVLHLKGLSADGVAGISPIGAMRESVGAAIAAQKYAARVFRNNARPGGGFITMPGKFSDREAAKRFSEAWHASQTGENAHRTPVFEAGMTYTELGMTNQDAQFVETRKYSDTDLCRIFGVPPHKVGILDRATYSNMEQQNIEFFEEVHSHAANLEQLLQMQLLTEDEEQRMYVQFEMKGVLRADSKTRAEFYNKGIQDGWMTRNEVREREDMEPLEGLDDPLEPLNMTPAGQRADDDAPEDRQQALLQSAAERSVKRELGAVSRIVERGDIAAVRAFYVQHAEYLAHALACSTDAAQAWCAARCRALLDGDAGEVLAQFESAGWRALRGLM